MKKTIGILAHVDAGKTTFAEQVLYHTNAIRSRGRVDHKDSFLDNNFIERERGITIFSEGAAFKYAGNDYYLIDTPGHVDFSTEMERAIAVMDYGIIIISAVEGVQSHTETLWNLLRKNNVPVIFFINKLDREAGDKNKVLKDLKKKLGENIFYIENSLSKEELQEDLIEGISELDEELLEKYLEGEYNKELWLEKMRGFIKEGKLFTAFGGSALLDEGIEEFLENLNTITYTNYKKEEKFSGRVFKVRYDENGNRLTFIKALSGVLRVKDELEVEENLKEKINAIRIYNGNKYKAVEDVSAGDVFAVLGLTSKVS